MTTSPPLARRLPGLDARHATSRARHLRRGVVALGALAALLLLAAVLAVTFVGISSRPRAAPPPPLTGAARHAAGTHGATRTPAPPTVVGALAPWHLQAPIDAEVVLPAAGAGTVLEVFGGSTTGNRPAQGVFTLDTTTGTLVHVANLQQPLADAAGAALGGEDLVLGGDMASPQSSVQGLAPATPGAPASAVVPVAAVVGTLPAPRAGATVVTVGTMAYVVGGTGGPSSASTVLVTHDGRVFTPAASLPIPVAYPAVAAVDGRLYVFGGQALTGPSAGQPVATIQVVTLATHRVTVAGRLPVPLAGATAVTLGGHVFVVGGDRAPGTTSAAVWAFDPSTLAVSAAGQLQVPVAHAGVAVVGATAWIIGGESNGAPTAAAQTLSR